MLNTFTPIFEQDGDLWVAYARELPGANTQGATLEEARENLEEVVQLITEVNEELAQYDTLYLSSLEDYEDCLSRGEIQWRALGEATRI